MSALLWAAVLQCFGPAVIIHYIFSKFPHIVITAVAWNEPLWCCSFGTSFINAAGFWSAPLTHTHKHTYTPSIQSPPGPCSCPPMAAFHLRLHGLTVTLATSQNTTALPVLLALFSHLLEGLAELIPTHMHFHVMWSYLCMLVKKINQVQLNQGIRPLTMHRYSFVTQALTVKYLHFFFLNFD